MAYDDLRDWMQALEKHGELRRIREEVSPELEITEITDRVSKIGARGNHASTHSAKSAEWMGHGKSVLGKLRAAHGARMRRAGRRCCLRA